MQIERAELDNLRTGLSQLRKATVDTSSWGGIRGQAATGDGQGRGMDKVCGKIFPNPAL